MKYRQRTFRAILIGLPGVVLVPVVVTAPEGIPQIALAANPLVFLIIAALIGAWAAPKIGLKSWLLTGAPLDRAGLIQTAFAGVVVGALVALFDHLSSGMWRPQGVDVPATLLETPSLMGLIFGITYGGVTEEILLRWGIMSVAMLGLAKLFPRKTAGIIAILFAATLFAAGHLPALFLEGSDVSTATLIRVLGLNGVLGAWFGWLFFSRDLESAIKAHAGFHVGVFAAGMLASVF